MNLPYVLNARQKIVFEDTFNLYAPGVIDSTRIDPTTKFLKDPQYSGTPTYSGIPGRAQTTPFATAVRNGLFRVNENSVLVLDVIRVHAKQEIADNWYVELTTEGHPLKGTFWKVEGGKKVRWSKRRPVDEATCKMFIDLPPF